MSSRIDPAFTALLTPHFQLAELERHPASIFGLWPNLRLAYVNRAWTAFADRNGGQPGIATSWGLGARYLDAIAEPLRPFYERLLRSAHDPGLSPHPVSHQYECSSAEQFRSFSMQIYRLPEDAGYIVVNALLVETPHDPAVREPMVAQRDRYVGASGLIVQCAHCRLVQRTAEPHQWDWVPAWVEQSPDRTSHGLCGVCLEYYYPEMAA